MSFLGKAIQSSVQAPKVIIPTCNLPRILLNIPFSKEVYVLICPKCSCVKKPASLTALLEAGAITPFLGGLYAEYPKNFVDRIIAFPHISRREFEFYRYMRFDKFC